MASRSRSTASNPTRAVDSVRQTKAVDLGLLGLGLMSLGGDEVDIPLRRVKGPLPRPQEAIVVSKANDGHVRELPRYLLDNTSN